VSMQKSLCLVLIFSLSGLCAMEGLNSPACPGLMRIALIEEKLSTATQMDLERYQQIIAYWEYEDQCRDDMIHYFTGSTCGLGCILPDLCPEVSPFLTAFLGSLWVYAYNARVADRRQFDRAMVRLRRRIHERMTALAYSKKYD